MNNLKHTNYRHSFSDHYF